MGDYNVNLLNYGKHKETSEFVNLFHSYSFISLINKPTRLAGQNATLIDNIFTNCFNHLENTFQCLIVLDVSDHCPIIHVDYSSDSVKKEMYVTRRNMSQRNRLAFQNAVSAVDWQMIYSETDMQNAFSLFHSKLIELYCKHFPKQKITYKYNNRKPWLSEGLKEGIKKKNKLYLKYNRIRSVANEIQYKTYRNKLNSILKFAEKKCYSDLLDESKHNIKKTWQIIKNIINKNTTKKYHSKFKMNDGSITCDKSIISEKFNEFFTGIGPSLAKKIPKQSLSPLHYLGNPMAQSIFLTEVTANEINKIIQCLQNGAAGHDDITASSLKLVSVAINQPLAYLCNLSFTQGTFPQQLKLANVLPLYKADDPYSFNNYRPVSLLCVLSKVFEKVMYDRLLEFLENHKLLFSGQFGFRRLHSSYMALMILMDKLISSLDKGETVIGIFLDFSKAFDTVDHEILLQKLFHYGVRGCALDWFRSYLCGRKQYVTYNNISSNTRNINCGVPQGSILGPLLFLIYINDLSRVCKYTTPILFADDTNIFLNGVDLNQMETAINEELLNISKWLKANKLSLNVKKLTTWYSLERSILILISIYPLMVNQYVKSKKLNSWE